MCSSISHQEFQIVGAGPAGRRVMVHEAAGEVGPRFQGDHRDLDNWTTENDVLDDLQGQGIAFSLTAGVLYPFVLSPEVAALQMSGSTLIVAINALMQKRTKLAGIRQTGKNAASGLAMRAVPGTSGSEVKERAG